MNNSRSVKLNIKRLQKVKIWQLIAILFLMLFVSATFLRLNNIGMIQRREAVILADQQGDDQAAQNRLHELSSFVMRHMNTQGNSVYLAGKYERDKAALVEKAVLSNSAERDVINKKVDEICKPQFSGYNQGYVSCFAREYAKYAPGADPVSSVKMPDPELYRSETVPPLWSPDFAGFSVLACVVLFLVIVVRFFMLITLKIILKFKTNHI